MADGAYRPPFPRTRRSSNPTRTSVLLCHQGREPKRRQASRGHGQAREAQPPPPPRRGGELPGGARRVHDRDPGAPVGLHPQGVRHRVAADAGHGGRRRRHVPHRLRPELLPLPHPRRARRLHRHPHLPPPRDAADGVLPAAAPDQPGVPVPLHRVHQRLRGAGVPHQAGAHHIRGGGHDARRRRRTHRLHLLGGQARPRLRVPGALPLRRLPHPLHLRRRHGALPHGQDGGARLRLHRRARLLGLHHLRHRQPHQEIHLRRVRRRLHHALPRHHQPLQGDPHRAGRCRVINGSPARHDPSLAHSSSFLLASCMLN